MSRKIDCMETECCDCIEIHGDCIKKVMERMPAEETLNDAAALFKVFGDPTRVKILYVLFQSELCVCDLAGTAYDTVCDFASASDFKADETGQEQT